MSRTLQDVVIAVESSGRTNAIRFEPDVYASPWVAFGGNWGKISDQVAAIHNSSLYTGRMIASTSWGAFQLMGFDLYGPDVACTVTVDKVIADFAIQCATWRRLVRSGGFDPDAFNLADDQLLERFARFYNGPGNVQGYHDRLVAARDAP